MRVGKGTCLPAWTHDPGPLSLAWYPKFENHSPFYVAIFSIIMQSILYLILPFSVKWPRTVYNTLFSVPVARYPWSSYPLIPSIHITFLP